MYIYMYACTCTCTFHSYVHVHVMLHAHLCTLHVANWWAVEVACGTWVMRVAVEFDLLPGSCTGLLQEVGGHGPITGQSFPRPEYLEASHSITDYLAWVHWHLPKRNFWMQMCSDWIWYHSGAGMLGYALYCVGICCWTVIFNAFVPGVLCFQEDKRLRVMCV